jgi:hypothetical protein
MRAINITKVAVALTIGAFAASPVSVSAQQLNFNGSANLQNDPSNVNNLLIDFLAGTPPTIGGTPTGTVQAVPTIDAPFSGSISSGTQGTIWDLLVSNTNVIGTPANPSLPVNPFLVIGGYTFTLDNGQFSPAATGGFTFGPITVNPSGNKGSTATFAFDGRVFGPGFGSGRTYDGIFTAQFSNLTPTQLFNKINTGGTVPVSFSANLNVSAVPEPATVALMATGLAGLLGFAGLRRRNQA